MLDKDNSPQDTKSKVNWVLHIDNTWFFLYFEFLKEMTIFSPPLNCVRPWPDFYGNFGKSIHEGHCGLAIFSQK